MNIGDRIVLRNDHTERFRNQAGIIVGRVGNIWQVVMDDPSLHDREFKGQACCGFIPDSISSTCYMINEMPELTEAL